MINPVPVLPQAVPIFNAPVVCEVEIPTSVPFPVALNDGEIIDPPVTAPDAVTVTPEIAPAEVIDELPEVIDNAVNAPTEFNVPLTIVAIVPLPRFTVFAVGSDVPVPVPIFIPPDAVESDPIIIGPDVRVAVADPPPMYSVPWV